MPDQPEWTSRQRQIELLAQGIAYMPHPGRNEVDVPLPGGSRIPFAERLYDKGHRVFPELAEVETVTVAEDQLGPYAAARTVLRDEAQLWKLLHAKDPDLYQRIRDAQTDEQLAAIAADIGPKAGHDIERIMAMIEQIRGAA